MVEQVFGYDMVGLNWPGHPTWSLYLQVGLPDSLLDRVPSHLDLLDLAMGDFLGSFLGQPTAAIEIHLRPNGHPGGAAGGASRQPEKKVKRRSASGGISQGFRFLP
mgnify:CR=1 FL=1